MRPALLLPCFWPEVRRGAERVAHELASGLAARGHSPIIITSHLGPRSHTVEDGIEIVRARRPPDEWLARRGLLEHVAHVPRAGLELLRARPDVAHALHSTDAVVAARWCRRPGVPAIYSCMGMPNTAYLRERRLGMRFERAAVERADAVVALSGAAAAAMHSSSGADPRVIAPGVDVAVFRPGVAPRAAAPTVFCPAALDSPMKRVPLLVEAFRRLREEQEDVRLVLSRPRDPELARRYEAEPGVALADVDDRDALARAYAAAWVTALPSLGEAFGLVLVESLACGTPVVATDEGGMSEIAGGRDEIGRLFAGDDPATLAAVLREVLPLARAPRTTAVCHSRAEDFSTDRSVTAYLALYEELLERQPAGGAGGRVRR